jgi:hypothetical protein
MFIKKSNIITKKENMNLFSTQLWFKIILKENSDHLDFQPIMSDKNVVQKIQENLSNGNFYEGI